MIIGAMNHPARDVIHEIQWIAKMGLGFVDLTLEPPSAASWQVDPAGVRAALKDHGLAAVGHTAYYLPIASPFEAVRREAVSELKRCIEAFAAIGVSWMNIHPDGRVPLHPWPFIVEQNLRSLGELQPFAREAGVGLMVENLPGDFSMPERLGELLDALPDLGFHLDIGHTNLSVPSNTTDALLAAFGPRLRHVHLHDNFGGQADLHLPLGTGNIDVPKSVSALKATGYNGTITLEVFSTDESYLVHSRDVLRALWDGAPAAQSRSALRE
jgi:sugar phosphate isomerase/epimerase